MVLSGSCQLRIAIFCFVVAVRSFHYNKKAPAQDHQVQCHKLKMGCVCGGGGGGGEGGVISLSFAFD